MKNILVRSIVIFAFIITSCATNKKIDSDDDFSVEGDAPIGSDETGSATSDDLALSDAEEKPAADTAKSEKAGSADNLDSALENELNSLGDSTENNATAKTAAAPKDELSLDEPAAPKDELSLDEPEQPPVAKVEPEASVAEQQPPPPTEPVTEPTPPPPVVIGEAPPPVAPPAEVAPPPPAVAPEAPAVVETSKPATIDNVTYQANSNGGTIAVTANQPLKFTTRLNSTTNQFIVEVENSTIPKKLKRSLNTKDMASTIGSVDIYQKAGSNVARFVVQLRQGSPEPIVQPEGNSILIIGSGTAPVAKAQTPSEEAQPGQGEGAVSPPDTVRQEEDATQVTDGSGRGEGKANGKSAGTSAATTQDLRASNIDGKSFLQADNEIVDLATPGIMSSDDLEEFLISNNKFYGRRISIETNEMKLRDALKFLSEESGVNLIIDESVSGNVSMKLRGVPWDQALILLLKSKKLGFKRQGSVLRIGRVEDFRAEEREAIEMKEARKARSPFIVKRFFIGYADVKDLEGKIKSYLDALAGVQNPNGASAATPVAGAPAAGADSSRTSATKKDNVGTVIADSRSNSLIVTDTEENMQKITKLIEALDTQPQQVLIEGKVVEAKEEFTRGLGVNWNTSSAPTTTNTSRIGINPALDAGSVVFDGAFTWGSLDVLGSLTARLALGEREDRVRVLSSPRIAVLSNAKATISQTAGFLIPKTSVASGGITTTSNDVVPVGVILDVTPLVSNEGTVSLNLNITRSFVARVDSKAPDERKASTQVIVKSGQTAVIGGIFESTNIVGKSGVPGFRDLPILGTLFQSESESKVKNELVIFVTPTILKPVVGVEKKSSDIQ